ncbi:MAG: response regulator transcription factor [Pyruvatibacter sp.]|uniref:response regulator transcription factor n=1 Tax=Pyruvatibacter sp. TaxID=1981328 RepID=UPI0032633D3E
MVKIVLADDHALVRDGLKMLLLSAYPDCEIVEATSFGDIISVLKDDRRVELIIVDFTMADMHASAGIRAIKRSAPSAPIIVVSARDDIEAYQISYNAGASAFVGKTSAHDRILGAVEQVLAGGLVFPAEVKGLSSRPDTQTTTDPIELLTPRQQQVLALLGRGLSNKEIAKDIGIETGTVKVYLNAIYRAFGVQNRTQAALKATQHSGDDIPSI